MATGAAPAREPAKEAEDPTGADRTDEAEDDLDFVAVREYPRRLIESSCKTWYRYSRSTLWEACAEAKDYNRVLYCMPLTRVTDSTFVCSPISFLPEAVGKRYKRNPASNIAEQRRR